MRNQNKNIILVDLFDSGGQMYRRALLALYFSFFIIFGRRPQRVNIQLGFRFMSDSSFVFSHNIVNTRLQSLAKNFALDGMFSLDLI